MLQRLTVDPVALARPEYLRLIGRARRMFEVWATDEASNEYELPEVAERLLQFVQQHNRTKSKPAGDDTPSTSNGQDPPSGGPSGASTNSSTGKARQGSLPPARKVCPLLTCLFLSLT